MTGVEIVTMADWTHLANKDSIVLMLPGIILGIALVVIDMKFEHYAVLPLCLMAIPIGFHLILLMSRVSLEDARNAFGHGWLAQATGNTEFWLIWEHYQFRLVDWALVPQLIPTWLAMYFVMAFSSSLDVAAIQMELGKALNFNRELVSLMAVGVLYYNDVDCNYCFPT